MYGESVPDNWKSLFDDYVEMTIDQTFCDRDIAEEAVAEAFWGNYDEEEDTIMNYRYFEEDCMIKAERLQRERDGIEDNS